MSSAGGAQAALRADYTAIGHVTVDLLPDGRRRAGGSALYAAVQAARLGLRARIVTCGVVAEVRELLAPWLGMLDTDIRPAPQTTTLTTSGSGAGRVQRILAWAGPVPGPYEFDTAILHLAPVAREVTGCHRAGAGFVGMTAQGLARQWSALGAEVRLGDLSPGALELARGCDAVIVSEHERTACGPLIEAAVATGGLAAVTAGARPVTLLAGAGAPAEIAVAPLEDAVDDMGAGDVFAAALFIALAREEDAAAAVRFASAAAAVRMSGHGPDAVGDAAAIARRLALAPPPPPPAPSPPPAP